MRLLDVAEWWMTGQRLAGSKVAGSLKSESPFPVLHHYHYSGQSCYPAEQTLQAQVEK